MRPSTLETGSRSLHTFIERSVVVRAVGVPTNKEVGLMLHGSDERRKFYYSAGCSTAKGHFRNCRQSVRSDRTGLRGAAGVVERRASARPSTMAVRSGGGRHLNGPGPGVAVDRGRFRFFNPRWTTGRGADPPRSSCTARADVRLRAAAGRALSRRFRACRVVHLQAPATCPRTNIGWPGRGRCRSLETPPLDFGGGLGEAWLWVVGDSDMLRGRDGAAACGWPRCGWRGADGLSWAARFRIPEGRSCAATTRDRRPQHRHPPALLSGALGRIYWYSKRFRFSANYVLNLSFAATARTSAW